MPLSEAKKKANMKWNNANLDRIQLVTKKGNKDKIKKLAEEQGESLNAYILNSVRMRAKIETGMNLE